MQAAMDETARRREKQEAYNEAHGITPQSVVRRIADIMEGARSEGASRGRGRRGDRQAAVAEQGADYATLSADQALALIKKLEAQMYKHAENLEFEEAGRLRDQIHKLRARAG
jgi:excinuclease ABC subunit B